MTAFQSWCVDWFREGMAKAKELKAKRTKDSWAKVIYGKKDYPEQFKCCNAEFVYFGGHLVGLNTDRASVGLRKMTMRKSSNVRLRLWEVVIKNKKYMNMDRALIGP